MTCAGRHSLPDPNRARTRETNTGGRRERQRPEARETATRGACISPAHLPATGRPRPGPLQRVPRVEGAPRAAPPTPPQSLRGNSPRDSREAWLPRAPGRPTAARAETARVPAPSRPRRPARSPFKTPPPRPRPRNSLLTGGAPPASGVRGKSRLWEGLWAGPGAGWRGRLPGACRKGRSGRSALVCEWCGLPLPTEVGRRAPRRPGAGGTARDKPSRGQGAYGGKGCLPGREPNRRAPGEGGQAPAPGSSALS